MSIKEVFISRYGDKGNLFEIDFSQLEIVALAYLTQDPQLVEDIVEGRDMHTIRARELFNTETPTKAQRTAAKSLSFQLQYGAGAVSMSKKLGLSKDLCTTFIKNYYERYPVVKKWQDAMIKQVKETKSLNGKRKIRNGQEQRAVRIRSCTGRLYTFIQQEAPEFIKRTGSEWGFKPTEIKNYFVQGLATGDIVPLFAGELHSEIYKRRIDVKLINTVHDSVLADVHEDNEGRFLVVVKGLLDRFDDVIREKLLPDWDLPILATIEKGQTWQSKEKIK